MKGDKIQTIRINSDIKAPKVRLIDEAGNQVGIVPIADALKQAEAAGLDLAEISPVANPPVAKILDYAKFKYDRVAKRKAAKKNQTSGSLKEVRFRLKIEDHDYQVKIAKAKKFLEQGSKVKIGIMFRGREQQKPQFGSDLLMRIQGDLEEVSAVETTPNLEGRNMSMVLNTTVKKESQHKSKGKDRNAKAENTQRS